jgi:multiple sugar transport system substrate-binding protein
MKLQNRLFLFTLLAVLLILGFSTVKAQDEPVTLNLWIFEGEDVFLPTVIERFREQNPHITVQITDIPESEYVTKIDTALLAGEPPDLGYIYERRWTVGGHFLPLNDVVESQGINIDDYNVGGITQACLVEGNIYCIGTYTGAVLLFYNKDMLDAAGIPYPAPDVPMTIDEYAAMAEALTVRSDNIEERIWGSDAWATYWWMDARTLFSEDGRTVMGYVNDEATVHTHQVLGDMRTNGVVISGAEASQLAGVDLLAGGKLATSITDNAVALPLLEASGINWGATVPPVEQAGDLPWVPLWSDGLGVFAQSDNPEEAALFAIFLGTVGNELRLEITGDLPLNMTLAEEANWAGDSGGRQEILAAVQTAREPLFIPNFWGVVDPIAEAFDGLMLEDGLSAQEAFDEVTPYIQENLDEAWEVWDVVVAASQ